MAHSTPRVPLWCACHNYPAGAVVIYMGAAWRASAASKGDRPGLTATWERQPTAVLTPKHDMAASHDERIGRGL